MIMQQTRCLYCYNLLTGGDIDFHAVCSRKFFGTSVPPVLPYTEDDMYELGKQVIKSQFAITGVQPKLSLDLEQGKNRNLPRRFTIVGLWGSYILKPPFDLYPGLPELEALTMRLSAASGIQTAPHALIRLSSGTLAYITKRIDRVQNKKLPMEDMCQLTERLTEHKYKGSYEQIGKAILKYANNPLLDVINFFEQVVFSFLTGNADMHLKNFSLLKKPETGWTLCPAYDMVPSALVMKNDPEELALNLNGKKRKIGMNDFIAAMEKCHIPPKAIDNVFKRFDGIDLKLNEIIRHSFLSEPMKIAYSDLIRERIHKLFKNQTT